MSNFLQDLVDELGSDFASIAADGVSAGEFSGYIDTGCLLFNAVLSGSIYGGLPNNKITAIAGEQATGKTFLVLGIVKHHLASAKNASVIYFDTEGAVTKEMLEQRGIDSKRVLIGEPDTIQTFRTKALKVLDSYEKQPEDKRGPLIMVLDSLGMMSTTKELEDTAEGKETRDMTKAQVIKAAFRVLTLRLAKANVPLIVTNHVYDVIGAYIPTKNMGGGSGLKYAASSIVFLSKSKDRDGKEVIGNFIKVRMEKSRLSKENAIVELKLSYKTGLDKYYGLLDLAIKHDIIKKVTAQMVELPNGNRVKATNINRNPEEYYDDELLGLIDVAARKEFSYGSAGNGDGEDEASAEDEADEMAG
jgi:RecA/RadA recombinase